MTIAAKVQILTMKISFRLKRQHTNQIVKEDLGMQAMGLRVSRGLQFPRQEFQHHAHFCWSVQSMSAVFNYVPSCKGSGIPWQLMVDGMRKQQDL